MSTKIKVLVVEDEAIIAMMISDTLRSLGYDVLKYAGNYDEALTRIEKDIPDIALLDIHLSGNKNGIDVARKIKETIDIPFIFLTSKSDSDTVGKAKALNPNAYLMKPFTKEDLYTSIELALYNFQTVSSGNPEASTENLIIKDSFFVKQNNLYHKVRFEDVLYIKSEHVYVEIHTIDSKRYLVRSSMNDFVTNLPSNFFRLHRSYTINIHYMDAINTTHVLLGRLKIPIGKNYRNKLMNLVEIK